MCWCSGHGEGWALYAERLMDELGYLDDPADKLGMLDGQSLRAARVIVDIGMHLELEIPADNPFGVPPGRDLDARAGAGVHAPALSDGRRGDPVRGQALPRAGRARLRRTRSASASGSTRAPRCRQRHGDDFDLKAFHRAALDLGSLGLDPLKAALARL